MCPLTDNIPKALVNIAGKTLLEWAFERYSQSGISDIVIAVGWKGNMIEDFALDSNLNASIVHVPNYEIGPLQTLLTAIETFDGDFLLSPVDAMIEPASVIGILEHYSDCSTTEGLTLAVSSNAESGTLVELGNDNQVMRIGGVGDNYKKVARSAMMFIGHTRIKGLCKSTLEVGKERVVNLLQQLLRDGHHIEYYDVTQPLFDIDTLSDALLANRHFLEWGDARTLKSIFITPGDRIEVGDSLTLGLNITLGKGISLQGPVLIGENSEIGDSCRLGPNVTIGANTKLSAGCYVSDALIFGKSELSSKSRVHKTIIYDSVGYNVEV